MTLTDDDDLALSLFKTKKQKKVTLSRLSAAPYASLMPPSELAIRETRSAIRSAIFLALFVFAVLTGLWAWSHLQLIDSNQKLIVLQGENTEIIAKQARFAEIDQVTNQINSLSAVKEKIDISKIDWKKLSAAIFDAVPEGIAISDINYQIVINNADNNSQNQVVAIIQGTSNQISLVEKLITNLRGVTLEIKTIAQDSSNASSHKFTIEAVFAFGNYQEAVK